MIYGDAVVDPVQTVSYTKATTITDGSYLIVANSDGALKAATPITSAKYGYLNVVDATAANDVIAMEAGNEFKFTAVDGGYTIQQPDGKYLYMKGTFNSFNLSDARVDGDVFTVVANADGTFKITNVAMNKYVQYSASYTSLVSTLTRRVLCLHSTRWVQLASALLQPTSSTPTLLSSTSPVSA